MACKKAQVNRISPFKIGDIVEYKRKLPSFFLLSGRKAVVIGFDKFPEYLTVKWIRDMKSILGPYVVGKYYTSSDLMKVTGFANKTILKKLLFMKEITNLEYLEALSNLPR